MNRFLALVLVLALAGLTTIALAGETKKATLGVKGMTCSGCALSIKSRFKKVEGVSSIDVSFKNRQATVEYDPEKVSPHKFAEIINGMGYEAKLELPEKEKAVEDPSRIE